MNGRALRVVPDVAPPPPKPRAKRRRKPKPIVWSPAAALRPIAWGERDAGLGALVCRSLENTMPPTQLWTWQPRHELPAWAGWAALGAAVLIALAVFT